ncbi:chromate transporter [Allorhizobium sp. BGMRC 0089]|uniref:chromate transporter n=1 Tax=Allorhizobium sonneratiae TaxID=2934936 RepID=UPI00203475A1|nr:chromate transporter [Allorhizobium sonneratiae]MCM2291599.1 chromate transporter [Allorhizobium sonneratiae]
MSPLLVSLAVVFAELSLMAFGGGNAILPEMQRRVVDVHHWLSASEFSALFALAQAAPGPNMMVVPLIGWHIAGLSGLIVTSIAKFGPSSLITAGALTLWDRYKDKPWRKIVMGGLQPMTAGLVAASAAIITHASVTSLLLAAVTAASAALMIATRLHPLVVLAAGAVIGMVLL